VFKEECASILESGYAYKIPELRIKKRETVGLPPLPKGNPESIRKTMREVHFLKHMETKR
jgi:hypothetical protein